MTNKTITIDSQEFGESAVSPACSIVDLLIRMRQHIETHRPSFDSLDLRYDYTPEYRNYLRQQEQNIPNVTPLT